MVAWHGFCLLVGWRKHRTGATGAPPFMAVHRVQVLPADPLANVRNLLRAWALSSHAAAATLLLPSLIFLAAFFALPALGLLACSFLTQAPDGTLGLPLTLEHYRHFFGTPALFPRPADDAADQPGDHRRRDRVRLSGRACHGAQQPTGQSRAHDDRHRAADRQRRGAHLRLATDPRATGRPAS